MHELPALVARVERLERANRRWRITALAALALLAPAGLSGQSAEPRTAGPLVITEGGYTARLTARGLEVTGADARGMAAGIDADGSPRVAAYGAGGQPRVSFYAYKGTQPILRLSDAQGRARSTLYLTPTVGEPVFDFRDAAGRNRIEQYLASDTLESPIIRMRDTASKNRLSMYLSTPGEQPNFDVNDPAEVVRGSLFLSSGTIPELAIFGADGKARAYVSASDAGGYVVTRDAAQQIRTLSGTYTDGSFGVSLYNAAGTVQWKVP